MKQFNFNQVSEEELASLIDRSVKKALNQLEKPEEALLTIEQAAELLHLTKPTLYSKVSKGEIPFMKGSKRLYFSREELINYIKEGKSMTHNEVKNNVSDFLTSKRGAR
jgi:excisionase family DNA binding protein